MRALNLIIFQKSFASFTNKAQRFSTLKNSTVLHSKSSTLVLFTPHNIPYTVEITYLFISIVHIYILQQSSPTIHEQITIVFDAQQLYNRHRSYSPHIIYHIWKNFVSLHLHIPTIVLIKRFTNRSR